MKSDPAFERMAQLRDYARGLVQGIDVRRRLAAGPEIGTPAWLDRITRKCGPNSKEYWAALFITRLHRIEQLLAKIEVRNAIATRQSILELCEAWYWVQFEASSMHRAAANGLNRDIGLEKSRSSNSTKGKGRADIISTYLEGRGDQTANQIAGNGLKIMNAILKDAGHKEIANKAAFAKAITRARPRHSVSLSPDKQ